MRLGRTRLALACVIGSITVGLAAPAAWATDGAAPTATATPSAGAVEPVVPDLVDATAPVTTPSAVHTTPALPVHGIDPQPSTPPVTHRPAGGSLPSGLPSLPGISLSDLDRQLIDLAPWLPTDLSLDNLVPQPLTLSFTCGPHGPVWTLKNTSARAYGFAWIDTDVNYNFGEIGAGKTVSLNSSADVVIAGAFDVTTQDVVLAIPAFAIADCATTTTASPTAASTNGAGAGGGAGGGGGGGGGGTTTVPVSTTSAPVATPATAVVTDKVHYTG
ncbi:hypothetical protein [Frankia sp. Cj3]|uniref:hypothetical protein n=2 Tax=unclassified Frankia TaxID=2632575 RepID=UPI001EF485B5|nr:hypothetical protein [Frankia sp. Cj3]